MSEEIIINAEKFYQRLERLQTDWLSNKNTIWGGSDALLIGMGTASDDVSYNKSSSLNLYLFGYEFPDSIILIIRNNFYFMSSSKKCSYLETFLLNSETSKNINSIINLHIIKKTKDEGQNRESMNVLINAIRKNNGKKVGSLYKNEYNGNFIPSFMDMIDNNQLEKYEISSALGLFLAVKDETELDLCRRAAVLSNKVMKHGFLAEMETVLDKDTKISHQTLATKVEEIIFDPSKINVKVSTDSVDICFSPIIQSGGKYDIKVNAQSNDDNLSPDIILCSLGARYKGYCANISRTFMVDVPSKVSKTYSLLISLYNACLETMIPGNEIKDVLETAKSFLKKKDADLLNHLPKTLGFAIGLEFRDGSMVLNGINNTKFTAGMVFNLSVGFHNVPLSEEDKASSPNTIKKLSAFSLLLADIVVVQKEGVPDVLTKLSKEFNDVSYTIKDENGDEDEDDEDNDDEEDQKGLRRSRRALEEKQATASAASVRMARQEEIMKKRLAEAQRRFARGDNGEADDTEEILNCKDLDTYKSTAEYPPNLPQNRLAVDLNKEAVLVPIFGRLVPFHVTTIKNVTKSEEDVRINFYISGTALGKEVSKNMQQLVVKYGEESIFIKELTFKSGNDKHLDAFYQEFLELRRRVRQREQKAEQEKDLVVQSKLIKIKDQRVPRLQEVTMRPQLSGRKCVGVLEAHQNGLRFTSNKMEVLDIMYGNIKHAIFQPCDRTTMVLVHFHLKDFILIGKKKQKDVQFYTEVIEASTNLETSRRSNYDPDELDDEQREREMRKRLNLTFKEFCTKVEKVANHYEYDLMIDVPFKKSGFTGNPFKEMVTLQPTTNCLVNLTDTPPFVLTLSDVEHVHFERVNYGGKNFDIAFILKDLNLPPRLVTTVDMKYLDTIQDWLNLVEITYTTGTMNLNWNDIMKIVRAQGAAFYDTHDEDGTPISSPAWMFLSLEGSDDEGDEQDEDSSFGEEEEEEEEEESEEDEDSEFEDEDDDDSYDEEEDLEEEGQDWDELEKSAKAQDQAKRTFDEEEVRSSKKPRRR